MSRWREVVREELARYREQTELAVVERQDLLDQSRSRLETEFPDNNTLGQSLSKTVRQLRKRDEVAQISPGTYRILSLDTSFVPTANPLGAEGEPTPGDAAPSDDAVPTYTAAEYETTATGRRVHPEFRETVLERYDGRCPVSGVDCAGLLDVAHILPWSEFADRRAEFRNVLALDKTHHAAFDRGLFTLDSTYRLRVNPAFETDSDLLRRTLVDKDGEKIRFGEAAKPSPEYLRTRNERLDWSPT
ncbi:HNH endonuclease [Halorussus pelagicus]|uniref:HNH endonuclease n=1 Tax=Halorussus pelagicus TaxID=2505977 RepID=UPI001FB83C13|nr:HNH endonuclease [Halorussus pelagicus]